MADTEFSRGGCANSSATVEILFFLTSDRQTDTHTQTGRQTDRKTDRLYLIVEVLLFVHCRHDIVRDSRGVSRQGALRPVGTEVHVERLSPIHLPPDVPSVIHAPTG